MTVSDARPSKLAVPAAGLRRSVGSRHSGASATKSTPDGNKTSSPASPYELDGPGLELAAPRVQTYIRITGASPRTKLRASDVRAAFKGPAAVKSEVIQEKGAVAVRYTAPMSGEYRLTLSVGSTTLNGGRPFHISCQAARPDEAATVAHVGDRIGFVDEPYSVVVECYDQFGGKWEVGGYPLTANVLDDGRLLHAAEVEDTQDGNFRVAFTPRVAAVYQLQLLLDGTRELHGSPFNIRVKSDETIPAKCKLLGTGLVQGVAGDTNHFSIQACDGKGSMRRVGGDLFDVKITQPYGALASATLTDNLDGTYGVAWVSEAAGQHVVSVFLEDALVGGASHTCNVLPAKLDAAKCSCDGTGLRLARAGLESSFTVSARDRFGNLRDTGGDALSAMLIQGGRGGNHDGKSIRVDDLGGGKYRCCYTANFAGPHDIVVYAGTQELEGCPFRVVVGAGDVCAGSSRVYGPGLTAVALGRPSKLFIDLSDSYGNRIACGSAEEAGVVVKVEGPGPVRVSATRGGDGEGVAAMSYVASVAGAYTITARVGELHLRGSPAVVTASTAKAAPALCEVMGAPLSLRLAAGEDGRFGVAARDGSGARKSVGGDVFEVRWAALSGGVGGAGSGKVVDEGNGEYSCSFQAVKSGAYEVSVTHSGTHIAGSPFCAMVEPREVAPAACSAVGEVVAGELRCNQRASLIIKPADEFNNLITTPPLLGPEGFSLEATGPQGVVPVEVAPAGESGGQLCASVTPLTVGSLLVSCRYRGQHIAGSPWSCTVSPDVGAARLSQLLGLPEALTAGREETVQVVVRDAHGNPSAGGDDVTLEVHSAAGSVGLPVVDSADGSYSGRICLREAGLATVRVTVNGGLVGLPRTLAVVPGPLSSVTPLLSGDATVEAGRLLVLGFVGMDAHGNRLASSGGGVKATVTQGEMATDAIVVDQGDGTYRVSCELTRAGEFEVAAWPVASSEGRSGVRGLCRPATTSPSHCSWEQTVESLVAGRRGAVRLARVDRWGNAIGHADVEVPLVARVSGPDGGDMTAEVIELGNGKVEISLLAEVAATYELHICSSGGGELVGGRALTVHVTPGTLSPLTSEASWATGRISSLTAGSELTVKVTPKDEFGNILKELDLDADAVKVEISGPGDKHCELLSEKVASQHGLLTFTGKLTVAGNARVVPTVLGVPLSEWPRLVRVDPAGPSPVTSRLVSPPTAVVGRATHLNCNTYDAHGNALTSGGAVVEATVEGPEGATETAKVTDLGHGSYRLSFTPSTPGRWAIRGSLDGVALHRPTVEIKAEWGPPSPSDATIVLTSSDHVVGLPSKVAVRVAVGAPPPAAFLSAGLRIFVKGPNDTYPQALHIRSLPDQGLVAEWVPAQAGRHLVSANVGGVALSGSPLEVAVSPGPLDVGLLTIPTTTALVAGQPASLPLKARDAVGHRRVVGGDDLAVSLGDVAAEVADVGDGNYLATFTPLSADTAQALRVTAGDRSVVRMLAVRSTLASPVTSRLTLCSASAMAGEQLRLARLARIDAHGNVVPSAADQPDVILSVEGPEGAFASLSELPDGTADIFVAARVAGTYQLHVSFGGAHGGELEQSPLSFQVVAGQADASKSSFALVSSDLAVAGKAVRGEFHLADAYGNLSSTEQALAVKATPVSGGPSLEFVQQTDDTLIVEGVLEVAGEYILEARLASTLLPHWPRCLSVLPGPACAARCFIAGVSQIGELTVGRPTSLILQVHDAYGNASVAGGAKVSGLLSRAADAAHSVPVSIEDTGFGLYRIVITPDRDGEWRLVVCVDGSPVMQEEIAVHAKFPPLTADDLEIVPATEGDAMEAVVGRPCVLCVQPTASLRAVGRRCGGRESLAARLTAPGGASLALSPLMFDADKGRHELTFTAVRSGVSSVVVSLDGAPLACGPVGVTVSAGPVHLVSCDLEVLGGIDVVAGESGAAVLKCRDAYGNVVRQGGLTLAADMSSVSSSGEATRSTATVSDNRDGTYSVAFCAEVAGWYRLSVGGVCSVRVRCIPGAPELGMCRTEGLPEGGAVEAGVRGAFRVLFSDKYGNALMKGAAARVPIEVRGCDNAKLETTVVSSGDGSSLLVEYVPKAVGIHSVQLCAKGSGAPLGEPIQFVCGPGPARAHLSRASWDSPAVEDGEKEAAVSAGDGFAVTLELFDEMGNPTDVSAAPVVAVTGPSGHSSLLIGKSTGIGTWSFAPTAHPLSHTGTYYVRPMIDDVPVPNWPRPLHIVPNAATTVAVHLPPSSSHRVVGAPVEAFITTLDAFGNNIFAIDSLEVVSAVAVAPDGSRVGLSISCNTDGTHTVTLTPSMTGGWRVIPVLREAEQPDGAVAFDVTWPPLTAADLTLEVVSPTAVTCGEDVTFEVRVPVDRKPEPWETPTLFVRWPDSACHGVPLLLSDGKDRFVGKLRCGQIGLHEVTGYLHGEVVAGAPLTLNVDPAAPHALACCVEGPPAAGHTLSGPTTMTVSGRDAFGSLTSMSASDVSVSADPPHAMSDLAITEMDNSAVSVAFIAANEGRVALAVCGKAIRSWVTAAAAPSVAALVGVGVAAGGGLSAVMVGEPMCVTLMAVDAAGKSVATNALSLSAEAVWQDGHQASTDDALSLISLGGGRWTLRFTPSHAGAFDLSVTAEGTTSLTPLLLRGSAEARVTSAPSCEVVGVDGLAVAAATVQAGKPLLLKMQRRDASGWPVRRHSGEPPIRAAGKGPGPVEVRVSEDTEGQLSLSVRACVVGAYELRVWVDGDNGAEAVGAPLSLDVTAGEVAQRCCSFTLEGVAGKGAVVAAGEAVALTVVTRDYFGNGVIAPAEHLQAFARGPHGAVPFALLSSPSAAAGDAHTFKAELTVAGRHEVSVLYTDPATGAPFSIAAEGSPASLLIAPAAACAAATIATAVPQRLIAGVPAEFTVTPRDAWGNPGAHGASLVAALLPKGGGEPIPCRVTEVSDGGQQRLLRVRAESHAAGSFTLRVSLVDAESTPIVEELLDVVGAETHAARTTLSSFWPDCGAVAGSPAGFVIRAYDEYGNARHDGGDSFSIEIGGLDASMIQVSDRLDGSYAVQWVPPTEGTFVASVKLGGHHVRGSPAALPAFRDISALADAEMERRLATTVNNLRRGVGEARALHAAARAEMASLSAFLPVMCEGVRGQVIDAVQGHEVLLAESRAALSREAVERKRLHNLVQELRGNIRVYVRVKPILAEERQTTGQQSVLKVPDDRRVQCNAMGSAKTFEFDRVFSDSASQAEVFEDVSQLVTSALDGYNVCIFAYGQTGAGKTHTMEGPKNEPGINYRTMSEIFRSIQEERPDCSYEITCSMVEIYNEAVHDLLDGEQQRREMELQGTRGGRGFTVPGLTERAVGSPEEIVEIMAAGFEHRAVGCHDVNAHSSRSHCLLIVNVNGTNLSTGVRTHGKLTLCDLAGSERVNKTGASGLTLTEAQNINSSLLALGNVISALLQQSSHVPYRNSKLTMLLQDSLGGDAKALMLCNVAQPAVYAQETLSSLVFASKVGNVVMKTPQRHLDDNEGTAGSSVEPVPASGQRSPTGGSNTRSSGRRSPTSRNLTRRPATSTGK